jgi:FKBP-type peptidyl-prolyl cis-trans isomerase FklB
MLFNNKRIFMKRIGMKNIIVMTISIFLFLSGRCHAVGDVVTGTDKDRTSYSVGFQIGEDLKKQTTDFDPAAFQKGVEDALTDAKPSFSKEEMRAALAELKTKIVAQDKAIQSERRAAVSSNKEKYIGENRDFLAANSKNEGVVELPSGLQYKVLTEGSGKKPGLHDTVIYNYKGTLVDGTEFGSSYRNNKPDKQRVDGLIQGMSEALQLMKEGARWRLFIPSDLAYGERGPLADRAVIIDIELISVETSR